MWTKAYDLRKGNIEVTKNSFLYKFYFDLSKKLINFHNINIIV